MNLTLDAVATATVAEGYDRIVPDADFMSKSSRLLMELKRIDLTYPYCTDYLVYAYPKGETKAVIDKYKVKDFQVSPNEVYAKLTGKSGCIEILALPN